SITGNEAIGSLNSAGGGAAVYNGMTLTASTIAGNHTSGRGGGILLVTTYSSTIANSTVSGNRANLMGGVYTVNFGTLTIANTTIAFNAASYGSEIHNGAFRYLAPGLAAYGGSVVMQSVLLANNHYGTPPLDNDFSFGKEFQTDAVTGS